MASVPFPVGGNVRSHHVRGFTLVEMLVVVGMIVALASVGVALLLNQRDKAVEGVLESDARDAKGLLHNAHSLGDPVTYSGQQVFSAGRSLFVSASDVVITGTFPSGSIPPSGACLTFAIPSESLSRTVCVPGGDSGGGDSGGGDSGGGPPATGLSISYTSTSFPIAVGGSTSAPVIDGASGAVTYSIDGALPPFFSFDSSTGTITGPAENEWLLPATAEFGVGNLHACVRLTFGDVECWGDASMSQTMGGERQPYAQLSRGGSFGHHTCGITNSGGVECWGRNNDGQLGVNGTVGTNSATPIAIPLPGVASSVAVGGRSSCALLTDGDVWCWGWNTGGQLGNGTVTSPVLTPTQALFSDDVTAIALGELHLCGILVTGSVQCAGRNHYGQLGRGTTASASVAHPTFQNVTGITGTPVDIAAGADTTCLLFADGAVRCWGRNNSGQAGIGSTTPTNVTSPGTAVSLPSGVTSLAGGALYFCALIDDGTVRCWGSNAYGQLGNNSTTTSSSPVLVQQLSDAIGIAASGYHACATLSDATVECWGHNRWGAQGNHLPINSDPNPLPTPVPRFGLQPGLPSTVTVTATDETNASSSVTIVLSAG